MQIQMIHPTQVAEVWLEAAPILKPAMLESGDRSSMPDILNRLLNNELTLWLAVNDDGVIVGTSASRVTDYARTRLLTVELVAGKDLDTWIDPMHEELKKWAILADCDGLELYGRKGWERRLRNYNWKPTGIIMELRFDER